MPFGKIVCHGHVRVAMFLGENACPRRRGHGGTHHQMVSLPFARFSRIKRVVRVFLWFDEKV
jgi:hypothetical protein